VKTRAGFSLLEVLVASTILVLVVILLASLVQSTSSIWMGGQKRIDHYSKARLSLDLIASDLSDLVLQPGLAEPQIQAGSISMITRRPGLMAGSQTNYGGREISVVDYRVELTGAWHAIGLRRGDLGFDFDTSDPAATAAPVLPTLPSGLYPGGPYQLIGPGILGFHAMFLQRDGNLSRQFQAVDVAGPQNDDSVGVFIAVAVADERSLQLLDESGQLGAVGTALRDAPLPANGVASSPNPQQAMENALQPFQSSLPEAVNRGMKVFQRYVPFSTSPH
jgi:hypothetical protein